MQKYAIIDIGTNSVRLMIANVRQDGTIVVKEKRMITTRLGDGLQEHMILQPEPMERTMRASAKFKQVCDQEPDLYKIYVFATNAVRVAHNGIDFIDEFRERFGLRIDVISGELEAEIAYLGLMGNVGIGRVIDIGGGSTELIAGIDTRAVVVGSVNYGCVTAAQSLPNSAKGYISVRNAFRQAPAQMGEFKKRTGMMHYSEKTGKILLGKVQKQLGPVYAVGGTATTLGCLAAGVTERYDPRVIHGRVLTHDEIRQVLSEIGPLPLKKRREIPILRDRADLICYGGNILLLCMDELEVKSVMLSDRDNLEGYLQYKLNLGQVHRTK